MKKLVFIIYGEEIKWAMRQDEMLKAAARRDGLSLNLADPDNPTKDEQDKLDELWQLERQGYIVPRLGGGYGITALGSELLSMGGFTAEAKKSKNDVKAFGISVTALVISLASLVLSLFDWLGRS